MGVLNDLRIALFDFRSYPKLLKNSKKRVFAFIVLVTGIFWLMTSVVPAAAFFARTGGFTRLVETYVPEFTLKNGTLQVAQPLHYANGVMYVDINSDPANVVDPSDQKLRTILSLNDMVIVADSKRAIFKVSPVSGTNTGTARMIEFSAFEGMTIDKNYLRQLAPLMNTMECVMCVLFFFVHLAGFFIHTWLITFAGRLFARISRLDLSRGAVFQLAVYTRAFPLFTEGVFYLIGLMFPEMAAIGMLYSMYALSRVFRHMSMSGNYTGRTAEDVRDRDTGYRNTDYRDAGYRNSGDPTPKTPDGGGVIPGYWGTAADADSSVQNEAADAAARKKTEELKEAAEAQGKPVRKPDHTEVREALVKEDLKPSDGWSFGSFAAEPPAEAAPETETAPAAAAPAAETTPAAAEPETLPAEETSSPETSDEEQDA